MSRLFRIGLLFCTIALFASPLAVFAQSDAVFDLLNRINALRRQNGLVPLELNDALSAAAQRHSQDMANTGRVDHTGSDGSAPEQRLRESGYAPNVNAWGENIYGGGIATVDDAWNFWSSSTVHRNNLLSERYREVGIGVAAGANGTYYTLNFGARPGVLPFFVEQTGGSNVRLRLSNEEAAPDGSPGRAVEVRIAEGADVSGAAWQPWQPSIPFTLSSAGGEHRITVEYRDASGVTMTYYRITVLSDAPAQPAPTGAPTITPTPQPTATATPPPSATPRPTATLTPAPSATETPAPTATNTSAPTAMPDPTSTPVRVGATAATAASSPQAAAWPGVAAGPGAEAMTPAAVSTAETPDRSSLDTLIARGWSDAPAGALGLLAGLQVAAIIIGVVWIARRASRP